MKNKEKYGLIEYLEYKLKKLYIELENNNTLNYQKVKDLKEIIDKLKADILEGVQIRSKIEEAKYGEMPSSYLVSKLNAETINKSIFRLVAENCEDIVIGSEIETTDGINKYANNFYGKLYQYEENDEHGQNIFINSLEKIIK